MYGTMQMSWFWHVSSNLPLLLLAVYFIYTYIFLKNYLIAFNVLVLKIYTNKKYLFVSIYNERKILYDLVYFSFLWFGDASGPGDRSFRQ